MTSDIVLLAAGSSTRLGEPKQLIVWNGTTLIRRAIGVGLASNVRSVTVVLGAFHERIRDDIRHLDVHVVVNPDWSEGIASSIRSGMAGLPSDTDAVILQLVDMPGVDTAHLNALIDTLVATGCSIVASEYAQTLGVPAIFTRSHFAALSQLSGDTGAKAVILRHRSDTRGVALHRAFDIDAAGDLAHGPPGTFRP